MEAYIVAGFRSAICKAKKGGFRSMRPDDLAAAVIKHLAASFPQWQQIAIDDLIVGNAVPEAEQGMQMGRMIALLSLGVETPGMIVNRYCGSGLEAIAIASQRIRAGQADCIVAGGVESMSLVPVMGVKTSLNYALATQHPSYYTSMGLTAEEVAKDYGITREAQDEFACRSHKQAALAWQQEKFKSEVAPVAVEEIYLDEEMKRQTKTTTVTMDDGIRPDTNMDALSKLKPAFAANGVVTAGNSSQTSDGAAFVLVMSERMMKSVGAQPQARLLSYAVTGVEPRIMGIGPVSAIPKALKQANKNMGEIDLFEINEAFAAQALAVANALDIDSQKLNVNGGAIAMGHPLGASGARLAIHIVNELRRRQKKYGVVSACVGGGQGVASVIELL